MSDHDDADHEPTFGGDATLVEALQRLRGEGYTATFSATADGLMHCDDCGVDIDPAELQIDERVRFEGASNPDDQAIVLAITCHCGCRGVYVGAYGPTASAADAAMLARLPR